MLSAALVLFYPIPTGWVSNISQRSNIFVVSVTASVGVKKSQYLR
jgi:hypothetical protein